MWLRITISLSIVVIIASCQNDYNKNNFAQFVQDSIRVINYIHKGDSIYAKKTDYSTFYKSLALYDSAYQIAEKSNDTFLIAQTIFAKGRAYDAINNNPQKTIDYYTQAAKLYAALPNQQANALYIKQLVAHSYDKLPDSINCIKILRELYCEIITKPDSIKKYLGFTVEMALISTVIKNYTFADSILQHLTKREWIQNDSTKYDYLNHFYLAKAKINEFQYHENTTPYIDSLEKIFANSTNLNDSIYYSNELWQLYKARGNKIKQAYYLQLNNEVFNIFNSPKSVRETRDRLAKMEVAVIETKEKAAAEKAQTRKWFIYILVALLSAISLLALFLHKRNKEIKNKQKLVVNINEQLQQKNLQNELMNKEIHHRVKNNLEMIMSLVYMQQRNTDTEEVKENMQNISLRIESIAQLHQQLMEQDDEIDLKLYVQQLVANVSYLLGDNKNVLTHLEIQPLTLPQKISFPLGLIINEWITNSVKYAQPIAAPLTIFIEISNGNNELKVSYKDNGNPQITKPNKKSLGLDIIKLLTSQLKATTKIDTGNLFTYHLSIPINRG